MRNGFVVISTLFADADQSGKTCWAILNTRVFS